MVALIISILSLIIAFISFYLSYKKYQKEVMNQAIISNENHMISIESRIGEYPELLRFHGVENPQELLRELGITATEFAYLLNSFTAGSVYYHTSNENERERILQPNSYRWIMCKSQAVKKAWPALKLLLAQGEYRDKLERIINEE